MDFIVIPRSGSLSEDKRALPEVARSVIDQTVKMYASSGWQFPWVGYLVFEGAVCVGTCAFTSAPKENAVEIAYSTFSGYESRGVATRMAEYLISVAKAAAPNIIVTAHNLPEENASTRVLRKLGFSLIGPVAHPEDGTVWKWSDGKQERA